MEEKRERRLTFGPGPVKEWWDWRWFHWRRFDFWDALYVYRLFLWLFRSR